MASHSNRDNETTPPYVVTRTSKVTTNLVMIFAVVAAVWLASKQWNQTQNDGLILSKSVATNASRIDILQAGFNLMHDDVQEMKAQQRASMTILRYLASGRKGTAPDAANEDPK